MLRQERHAACQISKHELSMSQSFNMMQAVKRRFFAMRNGALAEQMKSAGAAYKINFGLLQAQISDIADQVSGGTLDERPEMLEPPAMAELARSLRDNATTRESMLIAPMLFPLELLDEGEARQWLLSCPTPEVADTLCLKLLRRHPAAEAITTEILRAPPAAQPADTPLCLPRKSERTRRRGCRQRVRHGFKARGADSRPLRGLNLNF